MRVSNYIIPLKTKGKNDEFLLIHGYSGAIDVVSPDIYELLMSAKENPEELTKLTHENLDILKKRGYVTDRSDSEEKDIFRRVATVLHQNISKNYAVTIIPTYNCNFRCSYCFEANLIKNGKDWMSKTMSPKLVDHIFNFIDTSVNNGKNVKEVILFGGEPLLKDNYDIIRYIAYKAKERSLKVSAITNGYDLDFFVDLLSPDLISSLQITVDGLANTHNRRRVHYGNIGTFDKIIDNVDMCLKNGVNIVLRSNIDDTNLEESDKLISFYNSKGWTDMKNFTYYFKSVHACYVKKDKKKINDIDVLEQIKSVDRSDRYKYGALHSLIDGCFMNFLKSKSYAVLKAGFCGSTTGMHVIGPFGDIYACWEVAGDKHHSIGKFSEDGSIVYNDNNSYWRNRTVQNIDECLHCPYAFFCGGGCPAHARTFNNSIYASYCNNFKEVFNQVVPETYNRYLEKCIDQQNS
ncbi:radical SAM/SPASM domain-containing protein [Clostridium thermarum]|uniref:radical SAM/SPASM domain-containing protein n=1 Tax=Clostridium thermarum TaxID=1716543 RepID=UPI0013D65EB6|nr:radical SAM protein [Clostridium thermarum]